MDPTEITYEMVNKKLREIALARGKKGVDRQEQVLFLSASFLSFSINTLAHFQVTHKVFKIAIKQQQARDRYQYTWRPHPGISGSLRRELYCQYGLPRAGRIGSMRI